MNASEGFAQGATPDAATPHSIDHDATPVAKHRFDPKRRRRSMASRASRFANLPFE